MHQKGLIRIILGSKILVSWKWILPVYLTQFVQYKLDCVFEGTKWWLELLFWFHWSALSMYPFKFYHFFLWISYALWIHLSFHLSSLFQFPLELEFVHCWRKFIESWNFSNEVPNDLVCLQGEGIIKMPHL